MIRTEQKERELRHLRRFKESCASFPNGQVISHEKPDFIVESDSGLIGIEITSLFRKQTEGKRPLQEQEGLRRRIVKQAESLYYSESGGLTLHVGVHFHPDAMLDKSQVKALGAQLAILVSEVELEPGEFGGVQQCWENLDRFPKEIVSIVVYRPKAVTESSWYVQGYGWSSECTPNDIQRRIDDKNRLCKTYRKKCRTVWLLIVAEDFAISSTFDIPRLTRDHVYQSEFDRVFLFENFSRNVIELNIKQMDNCNTT